MITKKLYACSVITPQPHKVKDANSQVSQNAMKFVNRNLNFFYKRNVTLETLKKLSFPDV